MRSLLWVCCVVVGAVASLGVTSTAFASSGGIDVASMEAVGSTGCAGCHSGGGGSTTATVTFGSFPVVTGVANTVIVTVTNGSQSRGGFNLRLTNGTFSTSPGTGVTRISATEVHHSTPDTTAPFRWVINWTPGAADASAVWTLWANAVNGDGNTTGDTPRTTTVVGSTTIRRAQGSSCTASSQCAVSCRDGVCCNSTCSGSCQACSPAAGGQGPAGTCSALVAGSGECCGPGFYWNGSSCVLHDPCAANTDVCVGIATCVDVPGANTSYTCNCPNAGYQGNGRTTASGGTGCTNIDECSPTNPCAPGGCTERSLSTWTAPGYDCSCPPGYTDTGTACAVQDECTASVDDCVAGASCSDPSAALGNFVCTCPTGQTGNGRSSGTGCTDPNECSPNPCGTGTCTQTTTGLGWSAPGYSCSCPAGYTFDGTTCAIANDCTANTDDCLPSAFCTDLPGPNNFSCACPSGQTGDGRSSGTGCTDPNECSPNPCGTGTCTQTSTGLGWSAPGYSCACPAGYVSNGTTCVVQNECTANVDDCVALATCSDPSAALGNFVCTCPAGYGGDGRSSGSGCTNLDECAPNPCGLGTCSELPLGPSWSAPGYGCTCPAGLGFDGVTCVVENECTAGTDDCSPVAACTDPTTAPNDYTCTCPSGYAGDGRDSGTGCTNIDECAGNPCGAGACSETPLGPSWSAPGYSCSCPAGYSYDGTTCLLLNECTANVDTCVAAATCTDPSTAVGDFACTCPTGQTGNGREAPGTGCTDPNECSPNPCGAGSCAQLPTGAGWSAPGYSCSCPAGYTAGSGTCLLQDECVASLDDCVALASCTDPTTAPGNFVCTCPAGYAGNGRASGTGCTNVDECAPNPCGVGTCAETALGPTWSAPGYSCGCPVGYSFDGATCALQDECVANLDDCVALATCVDASTAPGNFACFCPAGYEGDGRSSGSGCADVDECARSLDDCSTFATCTNTAGGFTCGCNTGFSGDGRTCGDVDECADPMFSDQCSPNAACNNLFGDWECVCNSGYRGTGLVCDDIDECAESTDDCSANGTCTNIDGAFLCSCNPGYSGDGRVCDDVDECTIATFRDRCSTAATCNDLEGSWECVCNPGFTGDGFTCEDVDECADPAFNECHPNASCANTTGAYTCACNDGYRGSGVDCADIDECAAGVGGCRTNEVCVNVVGAPNLCECAPGFGRPAPDQPCVALCGDGVRGPGEACDDANTATGDGCDAGCNLEPGWACYELTPGEPSVCNPTCGDGLIDAGEECDDGAANSDSAPDACRTTCRRASCGDGVVDAAEACDDGAANSDGAPDACRTSCDRAYCGDGVVDTGERCDRGGGVPGAALAGQCTTQCAPDAGIDPTDPPALAGGACRAAPRGAPGSALVLLLALAGLLFRRRR